MASMKRILLVGAVLLILGSASVALGQKDKDEEPTSWIYFSIIKDENGKPVRNAAVVLHPVNLKGKQERGGLELKSDPDGKANIDGIPYGVLRVQVLAHGFQTYGDDFEIGKGKTEITIKLKRPQGQFSIYEDHGNDANAQPKADPPPPDAKKPN